MKFPLGQIVATPGALASFREAGEEPATYLQRHVSEDWGDVCEKDKQENELSVREGFRIMSAYSLRNGTKIWVITEASREYTTILLPSDY